MLIETISTAKRSELIALNVITLFYFDFVCFIWFKGVVLARNFSVLKIKWQEKQQLRKHSTFLAAVITCVLKAIEHMREIHNHLPLKINAMVWSDGCSSQF